MSSNGNQNIAIFIDGDNVSGSHYQKILDEMRRNGRVLVQRLYADFSKPSSSQWREIIVNYGIEAIQTFRIAKKESTDNTLIVDCMRTLYNFKNIQSFVIVSSDSDFSSLAAEIRLRGQFCIGIGYNQTPLKLRNNCDRFILIESLLDNSQVTPSKNHKPIHYTTDKGVHQFLLSYFSNNSKVTTIEELTTIGKKHDLNITISELYKMDELKIVGDRIYWLKLGDNHMCEITLKIIGETERGEIHMSWLKERLLNVDSTFDQRLWGFLKMSDYSAMIIDGTELRLSKDKNNEVVILK